jgi:hypothetical protein
VAKRVVGPPALCIREDLVGLGRGLELLLRLRIMAVDVGVQLTREDAEGLLDLGLARVAADAEHLVVVAGHVGASQS